MRCIPNNKGTCYDFIYTYQYFIQALNTVYHLSCRERALARNIAHRLIGNKFSIDIEYGHRVYSINLSTRISIRFDTVTTMGRFHSQENKPMLLVFTALVFARSIFR